MEVKVKTSIHLDSGFFIHINEADGGGAEITQTERMVTLNREQLIQYAQVLMTYAQGIAWFDPAIPEDKHEAFPALLPYPKKR